MSSNFSKLSDIELFKTLFEKSFSFSDQEINTLLSQIALRIINESNLNCQVVVGKNIGTGENSTGEYNHESNIIYINTTNFPNKGKPFSNYDLVYVSIFVSTIYHELRHAYQNNILLKKQNKFIVNPNSLDEHEQKIIANYISDPFTNQDNYRKDNFEDYFRFFQYVEYDAFKYEVEKTNQLFEKIYQKTNDDFYLRLARLYSVDSKDYYRQNIEKARYDYKNLSDDKIIESIQNEITNEGLKIAKKISKRSPKI